MVETFPSDRPDQSFRKTVLPRRAASDGFVTDAHSSHAACNHRAVDTIPITDQIAWSLVPRECLADLASNPLGSGICGDGNPDQAPAGRRCDRISRYFAATQLVRFWPHTVNSDLYLEWSLSEA